MSIRMICSSGPFSPLTKYPDRGYDNRFDFGVFFNEINIGIFKKSFQLQLSIVFPSFIPLKKEHLMQSIGLIFDSVLAN